MSSQTSRRAARRRNTNSLVESTLVHHVAQPGRKAAGNGLDAGAPNPVFADGVDRRTLIEKAAYARAEHRGFEAGHELEDWYEAERDIDARLFRGETPPL